LFYPQQKKFLKNCGLKEKQLGSEFRIIKLRLTLAKELGNPIISTSVTNRKGEVLFDPIEIRAIFNIQVDLMLSSGALVGEPSSIVDISDGEAVVLREGAGDVSLFE
jgi:tRNA A37 threonylcarbamoyladenosine synthetase subunit TsaC/SUA5/YrdC